MKNHSDTPDVLNLFLKKKKPMYFNDKSIVQGINFVEKKVDQVPVSDKHMVLSSEF